MEEKESTLSGSLGNNSEADSPTPMSSVAVMTTGPPLVNMNVAAAAAENITSNSAATPATIGSGSGGGGSVDLFGKKKRGRPRKYDADGNLRVPALQQARVVSSPAGFSFSPSSPLSDQSFSSSKRGRGRPPGSGNWQLLASLGELFANTAGGDFTPHVVTVNTGEDVAAKILSFSQKGPRGVCVLSANGAVSNVTIRQPGSSGGILTYEGRFEILSLSGSFTVTETGGVRSRTGGLSVSLAGPDGRVIGGGVAGLLLAASPIQIVIGSFMPNGFKVQKRKHYREHTTASVVSSPPGYVTSASPISQAPASVIDMGIQPACAPLLVHSHGGTDSNINEKQQIPSATNFNSVCLNGTEPTSNQRPSPDINVSLPSEEDVQGMLFV
ncbi:hypothetical protein K2173_018528 [Erythroxylum novogranatense]|uniref:AT-hook motif nuclear-localized protein n=1 Tax=Erythroxylum novogranatense TaxID=1862640 RepID=A0AAV8UAR3_9ROSI|nr:hypothetical protein K2173_018528 [Erythroxylum novogranatense]